MSHFAGEVEYSVRSFLEKNRDTINESLKTILSGSEQPLMKKVCVSVSVSACLCVWCVCVSVCEGER